MDRFRVVVHQRKSSKIHGIVPRFVPSHGWKAAESTETFPWNLAGVPRTTLKLQIGSNCSIERFGSNDFPRHSQAVTDLASKLQQSHPGLVDLLAADFVSDDNGCWWLLQVVVVCVYYRRCSCVAERVSDNRCCACIVEYVSGSNQFRLVEPASLWTVPCLPRVAARERHVSGLTKPRRLDPPTVQVQTGIASGSFPVFALRRCR